MAASIIFFDGRGSNDNRENAPEKFVEYASVLWKARIYRNHIDFVSNERVFHSAHFKITDRHVESISYRNLNGYFDPVLVTIWRAGQKFKALIIDPVREQHLLQVDSDMEIFVSITPDNKIHLAYALPDDEDSLQMRDRIATWPE